MGLLLRTGRAGAGWGCAVKRGGAGRGRHVTPGTPGGGRPWPQQRQQVRRGQPLVRGRRDRFGGVRIRRLLRSQGHGALSRGGRKRQDKGRVRQDGSRENARNGARHHRHAILVENAKTWASRVQQLIHLISLNHYDAAIQH